MGFSKTPTLDRFSRVTLRSSDGSILAEYPSLHDKKKQGFPTQLPKIQLDFERLRDFKICSNLVDLVGGLEHFLFSIYWEFHHPNWRTPSFFRGAGIPPTSHNLPRSLSEWLRSCLNYEIQVPTPTWCKDIPLNIQLYLFSHGIQNNVYIYIYLHGYHYILNTWFKYPLYLKPLVFPWK